MKYSTTVNGQTFEIDINEDGRVLVNGKERIVDFRNISDTLYSVIIDNASVEVLVDVRDGVFHVQMQGENYEAQVMDERAQRLSKASSGFAPAQGEVMLRSPMPGLIVAVKVSEGQDIEKGQTLFILESMKMENEIKSPRAAKVSRIHVEAGTSVEQHKPLVTLV